MAAAPTDVLDAMEEAWNRWDVERMLSFMHPEVEIVGLRAALEDTSYKGREGARRFFRDSEEVWESLHVERLSHEEHGTLIPTTVVLRLRGREAQVDIERELGILWDIDGGLVRRFITYLDPADAYAAARADSDAG